MIWTRRCFCVSPLILSFRDFRILSRRPRLLLIFLLWEVAVLALRCIGFSSRICVRSSGIPKNDEKATELRKEAEKLIHAVTRCKGVCDQIITLWEWDPLLFMKGIVLSCSSEWSQYWRYGCCLLALGLLWECFIGKEHLQSSEATEQKIRYTNTIQDATAHRDDRQQWWQGSTLFVPHFGLFFSPLAKIRSVDNLSRPCSLALVKPCTMNVGAS